VHRGSLERPADDARWRGAVNFTSKSPVEVTLPPLGGTHPDIAPGSPRAGGGGTARAPAQTCSCVQRCPPMRPSWDSRHCSHSYMHTPRVALGPALDAGWPSDLLTTAEVAAITRAPVSTVRYWRHLGVGPPSFRVGRRVVYRSVNVQRWLYEQEQLNSN
jgi:hypothetical protein